MGQGGLNKQKERIDKPSITHRRIRNVKQIKSFEPRFEGANKFELTWLKRENTTISSSQNSSLRWRRVKHERSGNGV